MAYGILAFLYKFMQFEFQVKDARGTINNALVAHASSGLAEAGTCSSNSTSILAELAQKIHFLCRHVKIPSVTYL